MHEFQFACWKTLASLSKTRRDKCSHDIIGAWIYLSGDFTETGDPKAMSSSLWEIEFGYLFQ